jgi:AraC-like DNA-binding protein
MYNELIIKNNSQEYKVFLQDGFYSSTSTTQCLHKHNYAEIHTIANGDATFFVGDRSFSLKSGCIMIIPGGFFHCCIKKDEGALHSAFQFDYKVDKVSIHMIGSDTVLNFIKEAERVKSFEDHSRVAAYVSLFCNFIYPSEELHPGPITDYGFLIHEFFSLHYSEDLHLYDLAKFLHLSERQTERLVIEYTGNTFRDELVAIRMNVAKRLLKSTKMTRTEISEYVGYRSYAGFWKAFNKYND